MRSTLILVVLVAMTMAVMGKRGMKGKKFPCVQYSACEAGNMTVSVKADPDCQKLQATAVQTACKVELTKKKCVLEKDFTACSTEGSLVTRTQKTGRCKKNALKSKPCDLEGAVILKIKKGGMRKRNKDKPRRNKNIKGVCKYSTTTWSDCDPITNKKNMVRQLKRGDPDSCNTTQVMEKMCKGKPTAKRCKYKRGSWSECDGTTNIKTMVKILKRGDAKLCPPTEVTDKICKRKHKGIESLCTYKKKGKWDKCNPKTGVKSREMILKKGDPRMCAPFKVMTKNCKNHNKRRIGKGCKYDKNQWGPCDAASNTVERTWTLKAGDPTMCNTTKIETRKCRDEHLRPHVCKYRRTTWGECDPSTNTRSMVKTLKRGDLGRCDSTHTIVRKCKVKPKNICKYRYEAWTECDVRTNTMTRQQVLKSGPASCAAVKEYSKKCKKPCRFANGAWSECDPETNQMTRTDTIVSGSSSKHECPPTRVLTKKCGKKEKCDYDYGTWTECDTSDEPKRSRTQKLVSGGNGCPPEKVTTKNCQKTNGKIRCFFGPWQEYDECKNGVQKKRRQVLQGGLECERKGVKMKAC